LIVFLRPGIKNLRHAFESFREWVCIRASSPHEIEKRIDAERTRAFRAVFESRKLKSVLVIFPLGSTLAGRSRRFQNRKLGQWGKKFSEERPLLLPEVRINRKDVVDIKKDEVLWPAKRFD
jgi:hypothetical protein